MTSYFVDRARARCKRRTGTARTHDARRRLQRAANAARECGGGSARYAIASRISPRSTRRIASRDAHRANLVVDHTGRERDAAHHLFGDVGAALAFLGHAIQKPPAGWSRPAISAKRARDRRCGRRTARRRRPGDGEDRAAMRTSSQLRRRTMVNDRRASSKHTLVPGLDPELLRQRLPLHASHDPGIMQPSLGRSNRKTESSFNSRVVTQDRRDP